MPKRKGRGRPKGSTVRKKVKESADGELDILDNPPNMLEVGPGFEVGQEADTGIPKKKGRGRPKGSRVQNCQESVDGNLESHINPSNMVEVGPGCEELQEADIVMPKEEGQGQPRGSRVQNCEESADGNLDMYINPSNMVEVSPGCKEEQKAGTSPKRKGRGRPRGTRVQNCQESADGNSDIQNNQLVTEEVSPTAGCEEVQEADTGYTPKKRGRGRPRGSTNQKQHRQNADDLSLKPKRKGRGRTRGLKVQMKRQQSADGKLDVLIHPTKLVAVGPGRKDFITDLSVIVRQHARHNVYKWKQVPQSTRNTIVQNILNNWRLPDTDMIRRAIVDEAGRLYRNWRNRLHDYYLTFETKEEALKHVPDDINGSDWQILVDYFSSPSFEIMSTRNKANKAKQPTNHACGPKSFQAVSYDARDLVTGKEPDMQTLWQLTHKRANGEWVDDASKEVNDKVAEQIDEKLRQLEDSEGGIETIEPEIINSAFRSVVGKKSYMQGFGAGLRSSSSIRVQQLQAELEAQKRETENARIECNEIRATLVEVESQLEEERRKRQEIEVRLLDRQKEMHEINSQVQTAIQSALSQYRPPTTEAETSSRQKRKIAELEAQLHEAEDVITDLRSELRR